MWESWWTRSYRSAVGVHVLSPFASWPGDCVPEAGSCTWGENVLVSLTSVKGEAVSAVRHTEMQLRLPVFWTVIEGDQVRQAGQETGGGRV